MRYILRRLGFYLLAFWASLTINFFLPRLLPGDPVQTIFGGPTTQLKPDQIQSLREALGLSDAPIYQQYFIYLSHVLRGDLGISFSQFPASVFELIASGIGWTLLMGLTTLVLAFIFGNILGIFVAWRRGGLADNLVPPLLIFIGAFPAFFLALAAVYFLGFQLGWFPTQRAYDPNLTPGFNPIFIGSVVQHLILPAIVMVLVSIGGWALGMRNVMIGVLAEDYITMAEAKGLSQRRIMFSYAARNALLPSVTSFGVAFGFLISGQVLVEQIFAYPGVGNLLVTSVTKLDFPLMQGLFLIITLLVLVANFIVDVLYTRLDPRVRAE